MPFMDKTCGVTRLHMTDAKRDIFATVTDTLIRHGFMPIDDMPEDRSVGWVNFDDMLDAEWRVSPPQKGAYIAFSMRVDSRRIPPAVLKKELEKALRVEKERNQETGKKYISRERKHEIREQVRLRLKSRIVPTPKVIDVIVDEQHATVYLTTTAPKEVELFLKLFHRSFDVHAAPQDCYTLAAAAFPEKAEYIDTLEDVTFGAGEGNSLTGADAILGRDFLTFVWFFSEDESGEYRTAISGENFTFKILDSVTVTDTAGTKVSASIGTASGDDLSEAKLGIAKGKKVSAAKVRLDKETDAFSGKLDLSYAISGLRLPYTHIPVGVDDDPDAPFLERMHLLERVWEMLDTAFAQFLYARLSPEIWRTVVAKINLWLRKSVAADNRDIAIQSQGHTEHIYRKWFESRAGLSLGQQKPRAEQ